MMSKEVKKVILGVSCIMSNGSVVSGAGTANIALVAKHYKIPVMVVVRHINLVNVFRLIVFVAMNR